ncbi:helix-turn-helix transcriptional regulator [Saccharopolyspora sp. K220]|uniref:helix-turn-helix domain-containing protein n=1 Tax=Saccharopolyspora soli TaxID=2926618 RepID=UPI001F5AE4C4|nr:helix-turn-helix transcriptional regulator [Saccharopolyspora soli]MCI2423583.1 helix-turn-helix transcriptional regulator [Saccharopolyspora soli]
MTRTSPTFRRRRLARRIRQLREEAGLTQEKAAAGLDMSTSALSRKETGEVATSVHEVRSMMDLYDTYDPDLLDLARAARERGWWRAYGVEDRGYVDLETEARTVRELSLMSIPGLLQTEGYMRAIFQRDRIHRTKRQVENDIAVRLIRQRRLSDDDHPIQLTALIDQAALERPVGGTAVMREQLNQMLDMTAQVAVAVRVLPKSIGWHAGLEGAFTLLEFPDPADRDVLFVAHPAGSVHLEKDPEVREARLLFEHLLKEALSPEASGKMIEQAAREL